MAEGGGEEPDKSQKTEDPSPKKIEDSRKKGQVANSKELNTWLMLLAATLMIATVGGSIATEMMTILRTYFEQAHALPQAPGGLLVVIGRVAGDVGFLLLFPTIVFVFAAFMGPYLQVGSIFAPEVIKPDISKISPIKGFKRIFSMKSFVEFIKSILKIVLIGVVSYVMIQPYLANIEHMVGMPVPLMMEEMMAIILRLLMGVLVAFFAVAVVDVLYQRYEHHQQLRMTKQEVKDEYKQTEGDPHIKAKLKQIRAEKARTRMMANVPKADVIITNPTHYAVALEYKPGKMQAPKVVAKGVDRIALKIREVAEEHKITIMENPPLARTLYSTVEVDESIPPELYQAVAEVISYVFRKTGRIRPQAGG